MLTLPTCPPTEQHAVTGSPATVPFAEGPFCAAVFSDREGAVGNFSHVRF